jgi:TolB-like protein
MRIRFGLALFLFPLCAGAAAPAPGGRPLLAVMDLKAGGGVDERTAATLSSVLAADAARVGFDVISQSDVVAMLAFQRQRQILGCSDDTCLAEIGGALGADFVLSGELARVGSRAHVALVILQPGKGKVAARSAGFSEGNDDETAIAALARFRGLVGQVRPDLLAKAPPVERPGAERLRARRTAAWWTLGAGGVVLAGGAVTGLWARSQATDLKSAWTASDYQARYDKQRRTALAADLLLGAGAVTAGVGAYLYFSSDVPAVVLPVVSREATGISVAGRF